MLLIQGEEKSQWGICSCTLTWSFTLKSPLVRWQTGGQEMLHKALSNSQVWASVFSSTSIPWQQELQCLRKFGTELAYFSRRSLLRVSKWFANLRWSWVPVRENFSAWTWPSQLLANNQSTFQCSIPSSRFPDLCGVHTIGGSTKFSCHICENICWVTAKSCLTPDKV